MNQKPYPFERTANYYKFTSTGKNTIQKVVEFQLLSVKNFFNLSFGDLMTDGSIDDTSNSNNEDIARVMSTVINILEDFIDRCPQAKIYFEGSTQQRTMLYRRILKHHYAYFNLKFRIRAFVLQDDGMIETEFDQKSDKKYFAFAIEAK